MTFPVDQPQKPFGRAIEWSDEDLNRLAEVTNFDIDASRLFWMAYAPPPYKSLLDATEVGDDRQGGSR